MLRSQTSIPSKNPAKPLAIDQKDLEQFIGILYVTSPVKMPSTGLYWTSEFYFEKVAQIMMINCFEFIKSNLHCNDNLKCPPNCEDKLYNLRPLIDHFQEKFSQIIPSEKLCIDELMVPFKGKSHLKQCNPQTPKKWGYKIYVLSRIDGIIYNFKSIQVQSCPTLVSLIFKHQEILFFNWCNIFHVFNGTSFILTTGIPVFYLKSHFMSRELLLLALSGVTVFTTASFQMTNP